MAIISKNPYTSEINWEFETLADKQLGEKISKAYDSRLSWKKTPKNIKKSLFLKMADILEWEIDHHAKLQTIEMWMIYGISKKWLKSTANLIRRFANNFEEILKNEKINSDWLEGHIQYDSLGIIYGIPPWNFPYNQLLRAAVPNILAWNTQIYKNASNVPLCALAIEKLFKDAGFPDGIYTNIFIKSSQSEQILANPLVKWVNITWWEYAGSTIWSLAWKYLKPSILELGGNDAFILLDHKDTDKMVAEAVSCRISNGWQKCNSSKRFIILEKHYDIFVQKMWEYMANLKIGDPMSNDAQLSSLATPQIVQEIHKQVQDSVSQWAKLVTWGNILDIDKNIYASTLLIDVTSNMTCYKQEIFWPVASVIRSWSIEESIKIANNNEFWLSAVVYGDDIEQCKSVATQLEWWMIFINQPAWSKASLPFGGVKKSWYGKENGSDGLMAFTNKKVVLY